MIKVLAQMQEFCEDCEGQKNKIQRSAALQNNAALPAAFERATGDMIYNGLLTGFRVRALTWLPSCCMHTGGCMHGGLQGVMLSREGPRMYDRKAGALRMSPMH